MKKWVALFLSILMLSSLLVTAASAEPVTLVFKALTWIADEQRAQNEIVAEWNAAHPDIQVQIAAADWGTASQELLTAFETGDVPDIFHYAQPIIADWKTLASWKT